MWREGSFCGSLAHTKLMSAKKARTKKKLDTALATRGVWLLKVPNYLAESWSDCPGHQELGVMTIRRWTDELVL